MAVMKIFLMASAAVLAISSLSSGQTTEDPYEYDYVLVISSVSRGENDPTDAPERTNEGYVILVLIILVIIALCVILYILRRVSRTYSFDLQRPVHVNHLDEPIGTFEPVYLDDLDQPAPKDEVSTEEIPPAPAANGTTVQSEENGSAGENVAPASEDQPDNKRDSLLQKFDYLYEDEQQNENNNNPSVCSSDPFVEINLDDPVRCDQLLTSPEAPSSVLPFSPFSFSTSSSTSS
ncbi:hypothetical protein D9C73_026756 [Collichthys lucidus]|uniref:Uncharacterized protein n=1 Tax=Collichthys lucidus TaxID=240159 RepID=A0A4U5VWN4_COLLU|nr:hypothetical protein D9C73_026756 [Collichthys lucidus]